MSYDAGKWVSATSAPAFIARIWCRGLMSQEQYPEDERGRAPLRKTDTRLATLQDQTTVG